MDPLATIKRLTLNRRVIFTVKAQEEIISDSLTEELVYESIMNAPFISKTIRSRNPLNHKIEYLYIIKGMTFDGLDIYTKGKILEKLERQVFYVLISSKKNTDI